MRNIVIMHCKKLYGTATVGTKGQVVIPAMAREELSINTADRLYVVGSPEKGVIMLLKEDRLEQFIEQMNLQVETFKKFKKSKN
jgi:AbrB family looped-hinge helix DNA binding protein